jgi:uncharacterized membrane protein YgdD (TMEM256/DUF423 family)
MFWSRRIWMTLAAVSAMGSAAVIGAASMMRIDPHAAELFKAGATFQFMHAMSTLACATVMQIGGKGARHAPGPFLGGAVLFSGTLYALALGAPIALWPLLVIGALAFVIGWIVLAVAAFSVDPEERVAAIAGSHHSDNFMRIPPLGRRT